MKKKQTAVEWLWGISQYKELVDMDFEQAIKIEKQQIKKAWVATDNKAAEKYYNENYGK